MNHMIHPLGSADISIVFPEISKFCYIKKYRYRFHLDTLFLILLTFLESLRIALISMVTILMMTAKMATSGLLRIKVFWKKGYDATTSVHDVISNILSPDLNYNVNVVMWPKFGKFSISVREVIIAQLYKDFTKNRFFLRGGLVSSSIIWHWH